MKNKENGITLIALIITIIVMLILVGVTINVALNGGLFQKAKTASDKTQREADREELLSAILGTANNRGDLQIVAELENNLPDGWNPPVQSENNEYLQCTSQKNNVFYVNKGTGAILDELPEEELESNIWVDTYGLNIEYFKYGENYQSSTYTNINLTLNRDGSVIVNGTTVPANTISSMYNNMMFVGENYCIVEGNVDCKYVFVENNVDLVVYMYVRDGSTYSGNTNDGWDSGLATQMFGAGNLVNGALPLYYTPEVH